MKHIVMFSGGVGSWAAARVLRDRNPDAHIVCLFADTLIEDPDLYRFIEEAAGDVGGQLVRVAEGRTPWQVFDDVKYIGNTRIDPCSKILKRQLLRTWLDDNCDPGNTIVYLGYDVDETHRLEKSKRFWKPWTVEAPCMWSPGAKLKDWWMAELGRRGIAVPRLYAMGFSHNNCGGFCIKAGHAHFKTLLEQLPNVFEHHENQERAWRRKHRKDVSILRDRRGGKTTPLTMEAFRIRVQGGAEVDPLDLGGCSCFAPDDDEL